MDQSERFLSPSAANNGHHAHHSRTRSFKSRPRPKEAEEVYERPRRNSMPSRSRQNLSSSFNDLLENNNKDNTNEPLRRVRSFKTTSKGGVVNRGDSYKKKSYRERLYTGGMVHDENTDPRANEQINLIPDKPPETRDKGPSSYTVVVLGPAGVGKTLLTSQFMTSEYIGTSDSNSDEEKTISVLLDGEESTLNFIDPTRDEVDLDEAHVDAYIVVFSTNNRTSFEVAVDTLHQLRNDFATDRAVILVANKIDLVRKRQVSADEARAAASRYDSKYAETSAALNHHVDELLVGVLSQIRLKNDPKAVENHEAHKISKERKGSFKIARGLLSKLFGKGNKKEKSCDNLYQL